MLSLGGLKRHFYDLTTDYASRRLCCSLSPGEHDTFTASPKNLRVVRFLQRFIHVSVCVCVCVCVLAGGSDARLLS